MTLAKTPLGKWSIGFAGITPVLWLIGGALSSAFYESASAGDTLLEDLAARPILASTMLAAMIAGICTFMTGAAAIIGQKESARVVYLTTALGAVLMLFLIGEFVFPHEG